MHGGFGRRVRWDQNEPHRWVGVVAVNLLHGPGVRTVVHFENASPLESVAVFVAVVAVVAMIIVVAMVMVIVVAHQHMERDTSGKGNTVVTFFFNVQADERNAFLVVVVFFAHHFEHHLNL